MQKMLKISHELPLVVGSQKELGKAEISMEEVKEKLLKHFLVLFEAELTKEKIANP